MLPLRVYACPYGLPYFVRSDFVFLIFVSIFCFKSISIGEKIDFLFSEYMVGAEVKFYVKSFWEPLAYVT